MRFGDRLYKTPRNQQQLYDPQSLKTPMAITPAWFIFLCFEPGTLEFGPYKTHCLSGFVQILEFFACNPFKLCGPRFPRG